MSKLGSLARRCTTGLVATQMLLGAVSVSTLALAAPVRAAEGAPVFSPQSPPVPPAPVAATPVAATPAPAAPAPAAPAPVVAPQPPADQPATPIVAPQPPSGQPAAPQPAPIVAPQPPAGQPATPIVAPQPPSGQPAAPQPAPVVAPQPAPQAPAPETISFLPQHGDWQGFYSTSDGVRYVGVMTRITDGGAVAVTATKDGQFALIIADPNWHFQDGMAVPVRLQIGGRIYTLTATTHGNRLEMPGLFKTVLQDLLEGSQVQLDIGNGAVTWTLSLDGFLDAAKDADRVIQA